MDELWKQLALSCGREFFKCQWFSFYSPCKEKHLLQKLEDLHSYFSLQEFCVIQWVVIAHQFYCVSSSLKEHSCFDKIFQYAKLDGSLNQLCSFLFQTFFPLDCHMSMTLKQLDSSLQDTTTALVTAILDKNLGPNGNQFEPMEIARVLVFLLARELGYQLYRKSFKIMSRDFSWRCLLQQLINFKSTSYWHTTPLVEKFLALSNLDLQIQLLLLENVLFCALFCQIGRGWFITSSSSLSMFSKMYAAYFHLLTAADILSFQHVYESSSSMYDCILTTA